MKRIGNLFPQLLDINLINFADTCARKGKHNEPRIKVQNAKRQLEYRMNYYGGSSRQYYKQKLEQLNYRPCYRYQELANRIR